MVYAPGHFQQAVQQAGRRPRRRLRERLAVRAAGLVALALIGVVVFSPASHRRTSGHGCVDFNYTTMIGGADAHECGVAARTLCATAPSGTSVDTDFQTQLYAACQRAGLLTDRRRNRS